MGGRQYTGREHHRQRRCASRISPVTGQRNSTSASPWGSQSQVENATGLFKLDLSSCEGCGGQVRVIASVEDPLVIGKILAHLATPPPALTGESRRPEVRGPPPGTLALG